MRLSKKILISLAFPVLVGVHGEAHAQATPVTIKASGNACCGGNGLNYYANISNGKLLPIFEGGFLWLNGQTNTFADSFQVDDSALNILDSNANSPGTKAVTGIFSDYAGKRGSIKFKALGNQLFLTGNSTITGTAQFGTGPNQNKVYLSDAGSFEEASLVRVDGQLDLSQNTKPGGVRFRALESTSISTINIAGITLYVGNGNTDTVSSGEILGVNGSLFKVGSGSLTLQGKNTYTKSTVIEGGTLVINGSTTTNTAVAPAGTLSGTGTITGNVFNYGRVSPGNSIGTLTINGDYRQVAPGILELEVGTNGKSDLLQINNGKVVDLAGQVLIKPFGSEKPTPGFVYTGISTNPGVTITGNYTTSDSAILGLGFHLVRGQDTDFNLLTGSPAYDPTKLQFGWVQNAVNPSSVTTPGGGTGSGGSVLVTSTTPGQSTINAVKKTGGAITSTITQTTNQSKTQCTANTGNSAACNSAVTSGGNSGSSGSNANNIEKAKVVDAGMTSVFSAANAGITGGSAIGNTGYTTNQAKAALVTPDFVTVYSSFLQLPTVAQVNQALHQITAEPYASMQSVALEALEQFRANTLALTTGQRLPFIVEEQACEAPEQSDQAADKSQLQADNCKPVTRQKLTPWSLLIDGSNTQATLNGTNDLASLDYNIFSSSYGLQYDFNPQWSAGAAFGYGRANLYNYEYSNTRIDSDTYSGAAWGIYRPSEAWKFTALAGYMNLQYSSDRNISFGGLNRNATANWSGNGFTTALAAEYDWILSGNKASRNAVRIKPSTYFSYALHNQGSFTESGAESLNLQVDSHTADSLIYGIGFTLETPIVTGKTSRLIPRLYVGYEYDFNGDTNEEHQLTSSFAELPALGSVDVLGQNRGANAVDVALSLEYETSDTLSLYGNVGGAFWSNGNEINYGAGLRLRW